MFLAWVSHTYHEHGSCGGCVGIYFSLFYFILVKLEIRIVSLWKDALPITPLVWHGFEDVGKNDYGSLCSNYPAVT